jgi:hypothetical protein
MRSIDEAIKEKRAAIVRLQTELETLERARVLLNGGTTHEVRISERLSIGNVSRVLIRRGRVHSLQGQFRPKSGVGYSVAVLREHGNPLHVDDLIRRIQERGKRRIRKPSLSSTLAKMAKEGRIFYRAQLPNTFGLLEWKTASVPPQLGDGGSAKPEKS